MAEEYGWLINIALKGDTLDVYYSINELNMSPAERPCPPLSTVCRVFEDGKMVKRQEHRLETALSSNVTDGIIYLYPEKSVDIHECRRDVDEVGSKNIGAIAEQLAGNSSKYPKVVCYKQLQ